MSDSTGVTAVWSQELQVHWPKSWRFLASRDVLLEMFRPQIFDVQNETIFIRYAENQDFRVSQFGLHIRILAREPVDSRTVDILQKVLQIVEPVKVNGVEATFSHVRPIDEDYDTARRDLASVFYGSWIRNRPIEDFALLWDEHDDSETKAKYAMGVVDSKELSFRVASAAGTSGEALRRRMPAWMKVRLPAVAVFMESRYASAQDVGADLAFTTVPPIWWKWRERSNELFDELTDTATQSLKGGTT